jgi:hypothetical protein
MRRLIAVCVLAAAASASADDIGDAVGAVASSTRVPDEEYGVARLFDGDDRTTWCAREKVDVQVTVALSKATRVDTLTLTLGNPGAWKQAPRVKQVFVTVRDGERTIKKVRHKWPDRGQVRSGTVNLGATGDNVLIDFDQVYAGTGTSPLCVGGVSLTASDPSTTRPVDAASLVAASWGDDRVKKALARKWKVFLPGDDGGEAKLELGRGSFEFRGEGLKVSGTWTLEDVDGRRTFALRVTKAKAAGKRLPIPEELAPHRGAWRFAAPTEGATAMLLPWIAFAVQDGALALIAPLAVTP